MITSKCGNLQEFYINFFVKLKINNFFKVISYQNMDKID